MSANAGLQTVSDGDLDAVIAADEGVLILAQGGCGPCSRYQQEIVALISAGRLDGVTVGVLRLDERGAAGFKRANPWLRDLQGLPHTLIYRRGERIDGFGASKASYLLERLERGRAGAVVPPGSRTVTAGR